MVEGDNKMTPERELLMDLALREILDDSLDAE